MEQTELLKMVVEYLKENGEQTEISDEDKIKAAYALNMCTVCSRSMWKMVKRICVKKTEKQRKS